MNPSNIYHHTRHDFTNRPVSTLAHQSAPVPANTPTHPMSAPAPNQPANPAVRTPNNLTVNPFALISASTPALSAAQPTHIVSTTANLENPAANTPTYPKNTPAPQPEPHEKNPSSRFSYRPKQYYAFHGTMYCKVPATSTIFVMQTISNQPTLKRKYMSLAIQTLRQTIINGSKTIALATALLLTVGLSSSFATPTGKHDIVKTSFKKDFKKAELMETQEGRNFTKITFKMNDVIMYAYYSENGELLAVTRNITSNQLPIQLLLEVKRSYSNYWISDLFELTGDGASNYYITLENSDTRVTLRSIGTDAWEVYSKTAKD
ncbi:hypothetical protein [Puia dinghuensis]|uniref:Uncharacterized protein n=1 Tax=Puia dinghuensis TaxID=1792502 RepID=A0A8J2UGT2_9BACT|nr:hypothetical protein [Puia dinghuensis]GGB15470.1 hypothetical protein GCM10011511_44080 [Puia dinghuensis]